MVNKSKLFTNANICLPNGMLLDGSLLIRQGKIERVITDRNAAQADEVIDVRGAYIVPGFIDIHVHGGGGFDVMAGEAQDIEGMSLFHAGKGTTSFLPTTVTHATDRTDAAIKSVVTVIERGAPGAEVLGIHLEGPFFNPIRCGAQNPAHIRPGTIAELEHWINISKQHIRLLAIAPETEGALEVIDYAVSQGIAVSIAHSDATFAVVQQAMQQGASQVTHMFNGMSPLHHREPGVAGSALIFDDLAIELICDGTHVHKEMVNYLFRVKPNDKIMLITDCIVAAGCPDGEYALGDLPVIVQDGEARLLNEDGTIGHLAGSSLTMDQALRHAMDFTGLSLGQVMPALTINPARQIGCDDRKGSIEPGKDADLVILDEHYEVLRTYVKGKLVYEQGNASNLVK